MAAFRWGFPSVVRIAPAPICVVLLLALGRLTAAQQGPGDDSRANYNLGIAYFRQGRLKEARPFLEKATTLSPRAQDAWMALSLVLLGLNDYAGAAAPLQHACDLASGNDACYLEGRTLFLLARYDEAVKPLEKAVRNAPLEDQPKIHRAAALNFDKLGNSAEAERYFRSAIGVYQPREGSSEDPRLDYGAFLVRQGRAAEALELIEQTLKTSPLSARANAELGRALLDLDRAQDALPRLQKAVELDPNAWTVRMLLGKAYLRLGRTEEGERELRLGREGWARDNHGSSKVQ
jgi:Flp pilus assembly protein TadD